MSTREAPQRRRVVARYYLPALVFATIPAHTGAGIYAASTPVEALSLIRVLAILSRSAALLAILMHALPGSDRTKGAALSIAVLLSGAYPPFASRLGVPPCTWPDTALGLLFIALVAVALQTLMIYRRSVLDSSHTFLAILAMATIGFGLYTDVLSTLRANWGRGLEHPGGIVPTLGGTGHPPDIIHIVFDGLGSPRVLERTFELDAAQITSELAARGMTVEADATANYVQTYLAMASLLSMDYLDDAAAIGRGTNDRTIAEAIFRDSAVIRALKARGYKFTLLSSGYEAVARHPLADDGLSGPTLFTQLEGYVLPRTMFRMLPIAELTYVPQRGRTLWQLKALEDYAPGPQPQFILVHLLLPHPPFMFTADGTSVTPPGVFAIRDGTTFPGTRGAYRHGYAEQAKFALAQLGDLLQRWGALAHPPLVIAQGDHGPGFDYDFEHPEQSNVADRLAMFLGLRAGEWPIGRVTSPVNLYRAVFNSVFGTKLTFLPDRSYVSSWSLPYELTEVKSTLLPQCRYEDRESLR